MHTENIDNNGNDASNANAGFDSSNKNFSNASNNSYSSSASYSYVDPTDHTADYDIQDIKENKIYALLPYLFGIVGVLVAKIVSSDSKFVAFHIKQGLKFVIAYCLLSVICAVLCWTFIVPIAGGIFIVVLAVVEIIAFVNTAKGKAKDAAIIKDIGFLN